MSDQEKKKITRHTELEVYQKAFAAAMKIFEFSKSFPLSPPPLVSISALRF